MYWRVFSTDSTERSRYVGYTPCPRVGFVRRRLGLDDSCSCSAVPPSMYHFVHRSENFSGRSFSTMDPLPRRQKEGGSELVEVYGFAGWIASLVAYALYLVWAYVPESTLHALGITYYPSKYWAIAIPSAIFVAASTAILVYIAVNLMSTAPLDSFDTITDMHAKPVVDRSSVWEEDGSPDSTSRVPNIGDIDMSTVNRVLYQDPPAQGSSSRGLQRRRRDWRIAGTPPGVSAREQRRQRSHQSGGWPDGSGMNVSADYHHRS